MWDADGVGGGVIVVVIVTLNESVAEKEGVGEYTCDNEGVGGGVIVVVTVMVRSTDSDGVAVLVGDGVRDLVFVG